MSDFDANFMQDDDLHSLLRQWRTPETPGSLDNRVAATYQQSMGSTASSNSATYSQPDSEVVNMKFCNTCQEEFADRFGFCPVDGTPLSTAPVTVSAAQAAVSTTPAATTEPSPAETLTVAPTVATAAPALAAASPANLGEYHLTILEDQGLLFRLAGELSGVAHNYQLTWPEFKRDPFGFVKRSIQGYGTMAGKFFASRDAVIALVLSIVAMAALVGAIFLLDRTGAGGPSRRTMLVVAGSGVVGLLGVFSAGVR